MNHDVRAVVLYRRPPEIGSGRDPRAPDGLSRPRSLDLLARPGRRRGAIALAFGLVGMIIVAFVQGWVRAPGGPLARPESGAEVVEPAVEFAVVWIGSCFLSYLLALALLQARRSGRAWLSRRMAELNVPAALDRAVLRERDLRVRLDRLDGEIRAVDEEFDRAEEEAREELRRVLQVAQDYRVDLERWPAERLAHLAQVQQAIDAAVAVRTLGRAAASTLVRVVAAVVTGAAPFVAASAKALAAAGDWTLQRAASCWRAVVVRGTRGLWLLLAPIPRAAFGWAGALWRAAAELVATVSDSLVGWYWTRIGWKRLSSVALTAVLVVGVVLLASLLSSCRGPAGVQGRLLLDRSSSLCDAGDYCDPALVAAVFEAFADEVRLPAGASFEVDLVTNSALTPVLATVAVPPRWKPNSDVPAQKEAFRAEQADRLRQVGFPPGDPGSSVSLAVWVSGARLASVPARRRVLYLVSDLRDERWDPEHRDKRLWYLAAEVPPAEEFVARLEATGSLPDLRGVEVVVCGVHAGDVPGLPAWSPEEHQHLRALWTHVFSAAGAAHIQIAERCTPSALRLHRK